MRKKIILTVMIMLITFPLLSLNSAEKDQRIIRPDMAALVVASKPVSDKLEINIEAGEDAEQPTPAAPDDANEYLNSGIFYSDSGMHNEAIEAYKEAININPDYAEAHYNIALSYLMINDKDSAIEEYRILKNLGSDKANDLYESAVQLAMSKRDNKYYVQVGAYKIVSNANDILEKLKSGYLYAYIKKEGSFNKVRILGIRTKEEGELIMREINREYSLKPVMRKAR